MSVQIYGSRQEWLEARRTGIGASDMPVILGLSPFKSALQLYHEKIGMNTETAGELEWLYWGNELQNPIAKRYAEVTGRPVTVSPDPYTIHWSEDLRHPYLFATLDAQARRGIIEGDDRSGEDGALEIKNASVYVGDKWTDEPPVDYQVQNQHQQLVGAFGWGSIAALIGGNRFLWADIERNNDFINGVLIPAAAEFWARVQAKEPPPIDGSESAKKFLAELYPVDKGTTIALDGTAIDWDAEIVETKKIISEAEARKTLAENQLKNAIGDNSAATLSNGVVWTFKAQSRKEHVVKASTFRVLRRAGEIK